MTLKQLKKISLCFAVFLTLPLWAHEDHDHSGTDDEDFTLFERNQDNLDWNRFDYPDTERSTTNLNGPEPRGNRSNESDTPGRW